MNAEHQACGTGHDEAAVFPRPAHMLPAWGRFAWLLTVPLSLVVFLLLSELVPRMVDRIPSPARDLIVTTHPADGVAPEPQEMLGYLFAITSVPLLAWLAMVAFTRCSSARWRLFLRGRAVTCAVIATQAVVAGFLVAMWCLQARPLVDSRGSRVIVYFDIARIVPEAAILLAAILAWVILRNRRPQWRGPGSRDDDERGRAQRGRMSTWRRVLMRSEWRVVPLAVATLLALAELLCAVFTPQTLMNAFRVTWFHVAFTSGEFDAILNGRAILVDFFPQYMNVLPYLIEPWFRLVGISTTTFTITMAMLSLAGFLLVYAVLCRCTGSRWWALLLYAAWVAIACFDGARFLNIPLGGEHRATPFSYYAVGPLRYFGPWVACFFCARFWTRPTWRRAAVLLFAGGMAAINNPDWGLAALVGAFACVLFGTPDTILPRWRHVARTLAVAIGAIAAAALTFLGLSFLHAPWSLPRVTEMLSYQGAFALLGFGAVPMPKWGIHWCFYVIWIGAIVLALGKLAALRHRSWGEQDTWLPGRDVLLHGVLLFSALWGLGGAATHFVGRSHPLSLPAQFPAIGLTVVLLAWAQLAHLVTGWRAASWSQRAAQVAPTLVLGVAFLLCLSYVRDVPAPGLQIARLRADGPDLSKFHEEFAAYTRKHARENQDVFIVYPYGHRIANLAGVNNVFPFAHPGSLLVKPQLDLAMKQLEERKVQVIIGTLPEKMADLVWKSGFRPVEVVPEAAPLRTDAILVWRRTEVDRVSN